MLGFIDVATVSTIMSLLSDIGRTVEKTKRTLTDSEQAEYVCMSCEEPVDKQYDYCPHCGEETVEPSA